jgi:signal transduction histidine kinase
MNTSTFRAVSEDDGAFLSTAMPRPYEWRLFLAIMTVSAIVFVAFIPYARVQLRQLPSFVAVYNTVLILNDFTTSIILFGQFNIQRSRAMLLLATGYLFSSLIAGVQLLTYPNVFTPTGLLGAGPQTAAWLYMFWHCGLPLAVILYVLLDRRGREMKTSPRTAVASAVAAAIGGVLVCWTAATWGAENVLPPLIHKDELGFADWEQVTTVADMVLAFAALVALWVWTRHTVLNLWLMVVMSYWLCDLTLSAYLNVGRYDLGFYAGRFYGALAASFVLAVLLLENSRLHRRLVIFASSLRERTTELVLAHETLHTEVAERERAEKELAHVTKISTLGVLTASIAHEVNQPLGAIIMNCESSLRWLAQSEPNVGKVGELTKHVVADARRASEIIDRIRAMVTRKAPEQTQVSLNDVVKESMVFLRHELQSRGVSVSLDLESALPQVVGDRTQLQQVVVNLAINAAQATAHSGTARRNILIRTTLRDPETVYCTIEDSGPGIDPKNVPRLFDTFFTTKDSGMGMGLPISRSIVEAHGGRILADNNATLGGARFSFALPTRG